VTHAMTWAPRSTRLRWSLWTIRAATAAGLAIDAHVHLDLAAVYGEAGGVISEGVLSRAEAVAGLLAATPSSPPDGGPVTWPDWRSGAARRAVMLVARNMDLGQTGGPLPNCTTRSGSPRSCWRRSPRARQAPRRWPEPSSPA
jgi:hypothetical protein